MCHLWCLVVLLNAPTRPGVKELRIARRHIPHRVHGFGAFRIRHDRESCDGAIRIDPCAANLAAHFARKHPVEGASDCTVALLAATLQEVALLLDGEGVRIAVSGEHLANHPERVCGVS